MYETKLTMQTCSNSSLSVITRRTDDDVNNDEDDNDYDYNIINIIDNGDEEHDDANDN